MRDLLLATTNRHKVEEFRTIFADLPYRLLTLTDVALDMEVEETGTTFQQNADLKALAYASASGMLTLADDSGIEIDALGGEPGVYSARFLGVHTPYEERFRYILQQLQGLPKEQRRACFRCVITIAEPSGVYQSVEGDEEGLISNEPRGTQGFGYDPIFLVPAFGKTHAELSSDEKHLISHRGRAARKARTLLENWPYHVSTSSETNV